MLLFKFIYLKGGPEKRFYKKLIYQIKIKILSNYKNVFNIYLLQFV